MRPSHATAESRAQARPKLAVSPWASQRQTSFRQRDGPSAGAPLLAAPSVFYARWPRIRQGDAVHYSRNAKQFPACNKYDHSFWNTSHLERSEEHTSELQSLMRISYAVFCLKKKKKKSIEIT